MRICIINPFAGTEFFGRENLEAIAAPGTEFDKCSAHGIHSASYQNSHSPEFTLPI